MTMRRLSTLTTLALGALLAVAPAHASEPAAHSSLPVLPVAGFGFEDSAGKDDPPRKPPRKPGPKDGTDGD